MPREHKKRGRRMDDKKRKHDDGDSDEQASSSKRRKSVTDDVPPEASGYISLETNGDGQQQQQPPPEKPFFGLLDDEEQEFFRHADDTLEANAFAEPEEKKAFLDSVFREAHGKELKLANSQSCSRVLERLVQLSSPAQCKTLFKTFRENFVPLMTHRFASHCCEALFIRAAPFVTEEMKAGSKRKQESNGVAEGDDSDTTIESLFLDVLTELKGNIGFLITDQYASHVLRILLLVLSGDPLASDPTKHLLQSKKKESITVDGANDASSQLKQKSRAVPASFATALETLLKDSVVGLKTDQLRALATHPNANPTLQLLLRLELSHFGKQRAKDETSIIRTLLPEDPITPESDSTSFINGMVYDPVGSHLIETIIQYAPGKTFKNLYKVILHDRLAAYARNEIAGHVACRILDRLGHGDLLDAHEILAPHISDLLRRNRTNVVRTLIERCAVRDIDTKAIASHVYETWNGPEGFQVQKLLKTNQPLHQAPTGTPHTNGEREADSAHPAPEAPVTEPVKAHFNILAQAMLLVPGSLSALILDGLIILDPATLIKMSYDPIVSRTLQAALTTKSSSIITTRKLVQHFYGRIVEMALDRAASHVVDCIWEGTHGLAFIRERIAEELAEEEAQLRDSPFGRAVWKNWKMDTYKRRHGDWVRQSRAKASNDGFQSFSELDEKKVSTGEAKTPLQLARERHAREKQQKKGSDKDKDKGRGRGRKPPEGDASAGATAAAAAA